MSESLDRPIQVPELTADEIQARVLHRDGLMLVIDKPAGMPVHRGPKGGANLESSFDALALRPAAAAGAGPPARPRHLGLSRAGTPSQGHGLARPAVQAWQDFERPIGRWSRAALPRMKAPSTCRSAASTPNAAGGRSPTPRGRRRSPTGKCWGAAAASAGSRSNRSPAAPINCGCTPSASGWPIVGDNIYGSGPRFGEPTLHLHSREIVIPISKNKEPVRVVAPAPAHLHERLRACGWNGE